MSVLDAGAEAVKVDFLLGHDLGGRAEALRRARDEGKATVGDV